MNIIDSQMMVRALQLAELGLNSSSPNPRVGCVIVKDGNVVGEGFHRIAGEAHAEINALKHAGDQAKAATVYLTLEPCAHQGRTGPCADALIKAGVAKVVFAMEDPNPLVAGKGLQKLRTAGIEVHGPLMEDSARELNKGFIKRMTTGLPWLRCKLAMSLDGRTAMADGKSQWITGPAARENVQQLRARSCAIITGVDTVIHDNPKLNVRLPNTVRQPLRIIVDSALRTPPQSEIFSTGETVIIAHTQADTHKEFENASLLTCAQKNNKVDLRKLLETLVKEHQTNELLVEAGAKLCGAFLAEGLVDEIVIYMAAKLMGKDARPLFDFSISSMAAQLTLSIQDIRAVGGDWRITAIPDPEG